MKIALTVLVTISLATLYSLAAYQLAESFPVLTESTIVAVILTVLFLIGGYLISDEFSKWFYHRIGGLID